MNETVIFAGPSRGTWALRADASVSVHPPAQQGDVYRAVVAGARTIGLVDGYFEGVPAVWHKEILFALSEGVHVLGAASMGALLLTAGTKGKRFALPNARVMIHQPLGGFQGQATEIDIHAREILKIRERLNEIMAKHTGQPIEKIAHDTERDYFMSGEEAKRYGLIDEVITRPPKFMKAVESGDGAKDGIKGK